MMGKNKKKTARGVDTVPAVRDAVRHVISVNQSDVVVYGGNLRTFTYTRPCVAMPWYAGDRSVTDWR